MRSPAPGSPRPDAEIIAVFARHDRTIGTRFGPRKSFQGPVVLWRKNTCHSVETAEPATTHIAVGVHFFIENKGKHASSGTTRTARSATLALQHTAKNNVQTTTYKRSERGLKIRFILPSSSCLPLPALRLYPTPNLHYQSSAKHRTKRDANFVANLHTAHRSYAPHADASEPIGGGQPAIAPLISCRKDDVW